VIAERWRLWNYAGAHRRASDGLRIGFGHSKMAIRLARYLAVPMRDDAVHSRRSVVLRRLIRRKRCSTWGRLIWRGETEPSLISAYRTLDEGLRGAQTDGQNDSRASAAGRGGGSDRSAGF